MRSRTGWRSRTEVPRSAVTAPRRKRPYCTGSGSFRPISSRNCSWRSGVTDPLSAPESMSCTGSPGKGVHDGEDRHRDEEEDYGELGEAAGEVAWGAWGVGGGL